MVASPRNHIREGSPLGAPFGFCGHHASGGSMIVAGGVTPNSDTRCRDLHARGADDLKTIADPTLLLMANRL